MKRISVISGILFMAAGLIFASNPIVKIDSTFDGIDTIEADGVFCAVQISGQDKNQVRVEGEITSGGLGAGNYVFKTEKNSKTLRVWVEGSPFSFGANVKGWIRLTLPKSLIVKVKTASGNIEAANFENTKVILNSMSGNITAQNITGEFGADAASGNLKIQNIAGRKILSTKSGSIRISDSTGSTICSTASGRIQGNNIKDGFKATSASGQISLEQAEGQFAVKDISGSIDFNNITLTADSYFESVSGSIQVKFTNPLNDIAFALETVSGSLQVADNEGNRKYTVNPNGKFKVLGKTISGSQKYK